MRAYADASARDGGHHLRKRAVAQFRRESGDGTGSRSLPYSDVRLRGIAF